MNNLITFFTITLLSATSAIANNNPETNSVTVEHLEIFTSANFRTTSETLEFTTISPMVSVQIYSADGQMIFMLPVRSNNVQINKNLFEKGDYKLGFILEGQGKVHFTSVKIK